MVTSCSFVNVTTNNHQLARLIAETLKVIHSWKRVIKLDYLRPNIKNIKMWHPRQMPKGAKLILQLWADLECVRTFAFAIVRLCEGWAMRLGVGWLTLTFGILCVQSILRWNTSTAIWNFLYNDNVPMTVMLMLSCFLKQLWKTMAFCIRLQRIAKRFRCILSVLPGAR